MRRSTRDPRVLALRNFTITLTAFTIAGHAFLGFENPWLWPVIALATGYSLELVLEAVGAWSQRRPPRFAGNGVRGLVEFLYPAHITSLAVNLLIYVNDRVLVLMFAVMVAISGKWLLQAPVRGRMRHYLNPSNLGIVAVLVLFPWVSSTPPYHFTESLSGAGDWVVPAGIVVLGTMLNATLTKRMWLIAGWVGGFAAQAVLRGLLFDVSIPAALSVMTGAVFVLFTNYMIPDPGTSPARPAPQLAFGAGAAAVYGLLTGFGVVYGLFFALVTVCAIRGAFLWSVHFVEEAGRQRAAAERLALEQPQRVDARPAASPTRPVGKQVARA